MDSFDANLSNIRQNCSSYDNGRPFCRHFLGGKAAFAGAGNYPADFSLFYEGDKLARLLLLSRQIHLLTIDEEKTCAWHHASTEGNMSKKSVEELLIAGGADEKLRNKYNELKTKEEFVALAKADGYEFSIQDLDSVLRESGDNFESFGNPPKRMIWWH